MLCNYLNQKKNEKFLCDLILSAADSEGSKRSIHVHRCIVAARCKHIANLLKETKDGETQELIIEDCSYEVLNGLFYVMIPYDVSIYSIFVHWRDMR
jgi:hypothetical protein